MGGFCSFKRVSIHLAELYDVETKRLNEQVKRNINRFPEDFMFELTKSEYENLKSQNATARWGARRTLPYAFTEHGVLMLSSVLKSEKAVSVNIRIMRTFIRMRELLLTHKNLILKVEKIERQMDGQGHDLKSYHRNENSTSWASMPKNRAKSTKVVNRPFFIFQLKKEMSTIEKNDLFLCCYQKW